MSLRGFEKLLLAAVAAVIVGCSGSTNTGDEPAVAFPNRRATFEGAGRRLGYVPNSNSDTVSVIDLDAMTLLASVPVGRDPVDIDGPRHLVFDAENGLGYVALSYPFSNTSAHAIAQGATQRPGYVQALNLRDLSIAGELRVDPSAADVAFSPATGSLAVAHADGNLALQMDPEARRANLVFVEPASAIAKGTAEARRQLLCAVPSSLAYNADGSRLFVSCTGEDSLVVVDSASETALSQGPPGADSFNKPYGLVVDPVRERLLVSNVVSRSVSVFDLNDTPNLLSSLRVPAVPMFSALLSDSTLVVPFQSPNGATAFDLTSGKELTSIQYSDEECMNPAEFTVTSDSRLFLVCEGTHYHPGAVVEVDPSTLAVIASIPVELYPERMSILEP